MGNDHGDDGGDLAVYSDLRARSKNYLRKRGLVGSVKDLARRGPFVLRSAVGLALDKRFDRTHDVDTSGEIPSSRLDHSGVNADQGNLYDTPPAAAVRIILESLHGDLSKSTFVDIGSGKGRVLLLASEHRFRKVLGIELSRRLHDVAVENISRWRSPKQRCFDLDVVCVDAMEMTIPDGPLVLYFFVPFDAAVMRQVVARIEDSHRQDPRWIQMLYVTDPVTHPYHRDALGIDAKWRELEHVTVPKTMASRYPIEFRRLELVTREA